MKNIFTFLIILCFASNMSAQNGKHEEFPQLIDSMYYMTWDNANNQWSLKDVRHYNYKKDQLVSLQLIDGNTRDSLWLWKYYYNKQNNVYYELYYDWVNDIPVISQKKETTYNSQNLKTSTLISNWKNGAWLVNRNSIYLYTNDKITREILQVKNSQGVLFNSQYIDYVYQNDLLVEIQYKRVSDEIIIKYQKYIYDEELVYDGKTLVKQVLYYQLKANSTTEYIPVSRRNYIYDKYLLSKEVLFDNWVNDSWQLSYKYIYFRKIENAKKVALCHNGRTIVVAKAAVPAHLAHGDYLGRCIELCQPHKSEKIKQTDNNELVNISPNPSSGQISIKLGPQYNVYKKYEIFSWQGKIVKSASIDNEEVNVDLSDVPNGIYFVRLSGEQELFRKILKQ